MRHLSLQKRLVAWAKNQGPGDFAHVWCQGDSSLSVAASCGKFAVVDAHIGRQHKHNNGEKYRYHLHTWARRYRLFKKSLRKRNLWPKMSSQEVAAYVAMAVAAAGAIVRVLRGRRGKIYDKYP